MSYLNNMGQFKSKTMTLKSPQIIDTGGTLHAEKKVELIAKNSIQFTGSTLTAGEVIQVTTQSFVCTNTQIKAKDIYLPSQEKLHFTNCNIQGNIHYHSEQICSDPVHSDWCTMNNIS